MNSAKRVFVTLAALLLTACTSPNDPQSTAPTGIDQASDSPATESHPEINAWCETESDGASWITADQLAVWDDTGERVYLCSDQEGPWLSSLVAPPAESTASDAHTLLELYSPDGPVEGCFDLEFERPFYLTDGVVIYETNAIGCDSANL